MDHATTKRRRTNVTLSAHNLERARKYGLNVSAISDAALGEAVARAEAETWNAENAVALAERRAWIAENGPQLQVFQVLKTD